MLNHTLNRRSITNLSVKATRDDHKNKRLGRNNEISCRKYLIRVKNVMI